MKNWRFLVMKTAVTSLVIGLAAAAVAAPGLSAQGRSGFGFNAGKISGSTTGSVFLTGGGAYVEGSAFIHAGGAFKCTETVLQGPLNGCLAGQGVRWDAVALLPSSGFKCTSDPAEPLKTAFTSANTIVLVADFYRQGDGEQASFTGKVFVSEADLDPITPGVQNVWIQQAGCGSAIVNFN